MQQGPSSPLKVPETSSFADTPILSTLPTIALYAMEQKAMTPDERRVRRRLSEISRRLEELSDLWDFAATTDAQYRMIEAEREALRQERATLQEIKGDL